MREKLETLPLAQLKELAKSQGIKGVSALKKAEIIDALCDAAEKQQEKERTQISEKVQDRPQRTAGKKQGHQEKKIIAEDRSKFETAEPEDMETDDAAAEEIQSERETPDAIPQDKEALDSGIAATGIL